MYKLTTFKGLVTPQAFVDGKLTIEEAAAQLYQLNMPDAAEALLLALKAIVVPARTVVYRGGKKPLTLHGGQHVPIFLGNDVPQDWDNFTDYVNNPEKNADGMWRIADASDDGTTETKEGATPGDIIDAKIQKFLEETNAANTSDEKVNLLEGEDKAIELMRLFHESIKEANQVENGVAMVSSLIRGLVLEHGEFLASTSMPEDGEGRRAIARMVNHAYHMLGRAREELIIRTLVNDIKDALGTEEGAEAIARAQTNVAAALTEVYKARIAEATETAKLIGGTWDIVFITKAQHQVATRQGNYAVKPASQLPMLVRTSSEDGNQDALILALALSNETFGVDDLRELDSGKLKGKFTTHSKVKVQVRGKGAKETKIIPSLVGVRLHELGLDEEAFVGDDFRKGYEAILSAQDDLEFLGDKLGQQLAHFLVAPYFNIGQTSVISGLRAQLADDDRALRLRDINNVYQEYFSDNVEDSEWFYQDLSYTAARAAGMRMLAKMSDGVDAVTENITYLVAESAMKLLRMSQDKGHKYLLDSVQHGDISVALGLEDGNTIDTRSFASFVEGLDSDVLNRGTDNELSRALSDALGLTADISQANQKVIGDIIRSLGARVEARRDFLYKSCASRIAATYVENPEYVNRMVNLAKSVFGDDGATFDEYSMSFIGTVKRDGKEHHEAIPLATMQLLGTILPFRAGKLLVSGKMGAHLISHFDVTGGGSSIVTGSDRMFQLIRNMLHTNGKDEGTWYVAGAVASDPAIHMPDFDALMQTHPQRNDAATGSAIKNMVTLELWDSYADMTSATNREDIDTAQRNAMIALTGTARSLLTASKNIEEDQVEAIVAALDDTGWGSLQKSAENATEKVKKDNDKTLMNGPVGKYFEFAAMFGEIIGSAVHSGMQEFTYIPRATTGKKKKPTKLDWSNPLVALKSIEHYTWKDNSSSIHYLVPNYDTTGAVDVTHFIYNNDTQELSLTPLEIKLNKDTGASKAHFGNTIAFRNIVNGVLQTFAAGGKENKDIKRLIFHPMQNYARNVTGVYTVNQDTVISKLIFEILFNRINMDGSVATPDSATPFTSMFYKPEGGGKSKISGAKVGRPLTPKPNARIPREYQQAVDELLHSSPAERALILEELERRFAEVPLDKDKRYLFDDSRRHPSERAVEAQDAERAAAAKKANDEKRKAEDKAVADAARAQLYQDGFIEDDFSEADIKKLVRTLVSGKTIANKEERDAILNKGKKGKK